MTKTNDVSNTATITCGFSLLHGTPVFVVPALERNNAELKRVLGATFLRDRMTWVFPGFYPFTQDVVRDLKIVIPGLQFSQEAQMHIVHADDVAAAVTAPSPPTAYREDFKFITEPFQHQRDALNYALRLYRCGIFYDCGLGKTKVIIDLIRHERQKTLVLVPVVGIDMWYNEIQLHGGGELTATCLTGTPKKKRAILEASPAYDVLIVGYDTAKRFYDGIINIFPYTTIVADESHNLRGNRSARTKGAIALAVRACRRIILSGTPSLGNPLHLWGQLQFLGKFIPAKDAWTFRRHYTVSPKSQPKMIVGYKNLDMLNDKVSRIAIRRTKEECLDLPKRRIIDVLFTPSNEQKKMYNELVDGACTMLLNGDLYESANAAATISKLLQILSGVFIEAPPAICDGCAHLKQCVDNNIKPFTRRCQKESTPRPQVVQRLKTNPKLEMLGELLDSILAEDRNKVIIWGYFIAELDVVEELLKKRNIGYVRVDGSNSSHAPAIAKAFNTDPTIRVYLANIATGVALTLTAATYTIYFGLTYKLDDYLQSMDRNYRIGQELPVVVYRLIAPDSVLGYVAEALQRKRDIAATLTDNIDCIMCARNVICLGLNTKPFGDGCVYRAKVGRVITHPQNI